MSTIPSRLARAAQTSPSLADARRRSIKLYRDWYRAVRVGCLLCSPTLTSCSVIQAPEIVSIYGLNVPPALIRARVREKFEQQRYVTDPAVLDILLHKGQLEYQVSLQRLTYDSGERPC